MGEMSLPARQHGTIEQRRDPVGDPHHVAEESKNHLIPALEKLSDETHFRRIPRRLTKKLEKTV